VARHSGEATTLRNLAREHPDDPGRWRAALADGGDRGEGVASGAG
jgi:hypothetical protein